MKILIGLVAGLTLAGPALAQSNEAPARDAQASGEKPEMCEMMHNGMKMQGMVMKGKDGMMSCCMMDHSKMDHSGMDHGMMGGHQSGAKPTNDTSAAEAPAEDHAAHKDHGPD